MKKIIINKLALAFVLVVFAFATAQTSLQVKLVAETKVDKLGGVRANTNGSNNPGPAEFYQGGKFVDEIHLGFTATIDNVVARLKIREAGGNDATGLKFDSASLEVKDLFDGLLTFKFFNIGFYQGVNGIIRADYGAYGIEFTIKPIDLLSISLGYGISRSGVYNGATYGTNGLVVVTNNFDGTTPKNVHFIRADVGINNAFVPTTISFGTMIADGNQLRLAKNTNEVTNAAVKYSAVKLLGMSVGLSADLLAFLKADALKLDLAVRLPFAASRVYDLGQAGDFKSEINFIAALYGSVENLGVEGLGLQYYLHYGLDNYTKGYFDGINNYSAGSRFEDKNSRGFFKIELEPSYTIGQFRFDVKGQFTMIGAKEAYSETFGSVLIPNNGTATGFSLDNKLAYNAFYVEPEITWTPATDNSVSFYFRYYNKNLDITDNAKMALGLRYNFVFGIQGI